MLSPADMSDRDKVKVLIDALNKIEKELGIRRDFVPLGHAIPVAQIIKDAKRAIAG